MLNASKKLVGVAALVLLACSTSATAHESELEVASRGSLVSLHGARSSIAEQRYERITTKKAWDKLWSEHTTGRGAKNFGSPDQIPSLIARSQARCSTGRPSPSRRRWIGSQRLGV